MFVVIVGYMLCIYDLGGVLGGFVCGIIGDKYFEGKCMVFGVLLCVLFIFVIGGY